MSELREELGIREHHVCIEKKEAYFHRDRFALHDFIVSKCVDQAPAGYEYLRLIAISENSWQYDVSCLYKKLPPPQPPKKPRGMRGCMIGYHHP